MLASRKALDAVSTALAEVIDLKRMQEQILNAKVETELLKGAVAVRDEQIKYLKTELARYESMQPSNRPLYWTEEEEEAKWWLDRGLIEKSQYEDMLSAAGFQNTEIDFEPQDYPRLSAAVPS